MNSFRRLSAIDQAEAALEQAIGEGKWGEALPSYQNLSRLLGLSMPTVALAVARLVKRGLVVSPGSRQRFRIVAKPGKARPRAARPAATQAKHLLVLCPNPRENWPLWQRDVVFGVMQSAQADGWGCTLETVDYTRANRVLKRWDNLLLHHQPTHLFVIQGTRNLALWANRHGIKVAFVGGHTLKPEEGTSIGIHIRDILGHCARELHARGHRRILIPYWGDLKGFVRNAAYAFGKATGRDPEKLIADGWIFGAPHTTADDHRVRLTREMRKLAPTAIIAITWHDYLVAQQCAAAAGLSVPRDLSLVALNPSPDTEWSLPRPSHYRMGQSFFTDCVADWRRGKSVQAEALGRAIAEAWVPGESVGPARATA